MPASTCLSSQALPLETRFWARDVDVPIVQMVVSEPFNFGELSRPLMMFNPDKLSCSARGLVLGTYTKRAVPGLTETPSKMSEERLDMMELALDRVFICILPFVAGCSRAGGGVVGGL
jgi:hypothetical protein